MDRSIKPGDDFFLYSNGCYPAAGASNPHSPAPFRVIGATRNLDDWYNAFAAGSARETLVKPA